MEEGKAIEQFIILAKNQKAKALEAIISQALNHQKIFSFNELLCLPNVQAMKSGSSAKYFKTLELFAYGNYRTYKANAKLFTELSPQQVKKLKMISIVDIASKEKTIPYKKLLKDLDVPNVRQLEDLIINCVYNNLIVGKLDSERGELVVEYTYGRDVKQDSVPELLHIMKKWYERIKKIEKILEQKVYSVNAAIIASKKEKEENETTQTKMRLAMEQELQTQELSKMQGAMKQGSHAHMQDMGPYPH